MEPQACWLVLSRLGRRSSARLLTVVFVAREWSGEPENREPGKHAQVRWVRTSAIPEAFVPTTATALRDYLTGGPDLSLDGWK
jgi:ADP-ribose pyrophosphatase YjhB (NUDIX family)